MKTKILVYFVYLLLFVLSGCSASSNVEFKGDRAKKGPSQINYAQAASATEGGVTHAALPSGKFVSFSAGDPIKAVKGVTPNGYTVQYNIQGKLSQ